jgi:uncharacterized protein YkwD
LAAIPFCSKLWHHKLNIFEFVEVLMVRRIVLGLALFLQSTVLLADCYKTDIGTCGVEKSMLEATNAFRAQYGLPALQYKKELNWAARKWSESMAATGRLSHDGFPTLRNQTIILEFPASNQKVHGENVAYFQGYKPPDFGRFFVDMWIKSGPHRQNMLRNFRFIGVGYGRNNGQHYATQLFAW